MKNNLNKGRAKFVLFSMLFLFSFSLVSASFGFNNGDSLGVFQQNYQVQIIQTCDNCTSVNITSIKSANGNLINISSSMTQDGTFFNYTLSAGHVSSIGKYIVGGVGNPNGTQTSWVSSFEVTPSGLITNSNYYWLILLVSGAIIFLGFRVRDGWIVILGTFGLYFLGIYTLFYGVVGVKDQVITNSFAIIILAVAGYLSIKSGMEMTRLE